MLFFFPCCILVLLVLETGEIMRILITNDDSISATQLIPLIRWCQKLGDVTTVVPKFEQSGKSHSIELHKAFEAKLVHPEPSIDIYTVDSSPADCVRYAVFGMGMEFDLVISGINRGFNMGSDMLYSGTMAAASEAVLQGIPAIALSTSIPYYEEAITHLDQIFDYIRDHKLLEIHNAYNINIPPQPTGIRITRQGGPYYLDDFVHQGNDMYMPKGKCVYQDSGCLELDTDAVKHGYISIMPLTVDRTDYRVLEQLRK